MLWAYRRFFVVGQKLPQENLLNLLENLYKTIDKLQKSEYNICRKEKKEAENEKKLVQSYAVG